VVHALAGNLAGVEARTTANDAGQVAEEARDSTALEWGARIGFVVYGVMYGVIAWLTLQVALGERHSQVSRQGALDQVARQPLGHTILWVVFAGFCALVLWEAATAVAGHREKDGAKKVIARLGSAAKVVVFGAFAVSTAKVALGSSSKGGSSTKGWTARVLSWPAGPVIVAVVGAAIVGFGLYSIYRGLSDKWRRDLDPEGTRGDLGRAITVVAKLGYSSRGIAFGIIGGLVVWAALTHDAQHSGGLDQALERLRGAPAGSALLVVIALGFVCYGLYNVARAWYLRRK
jgi:hypothetical protein